MNNIDALKRRFWDKVNNQMRYDLFCGFSREHSKYQNEQVFVMENITVNEPITGYSFRSLNEFKVLNSTGLYDKNQKLIFESDIVKFNRKEKEQNTENEKTWVEICEIRYVDGIFRAINPQKNAMNTMLYFTDLKESEIIGNIYQNKELLNSILNTDISILLPTTDSI